MKIINIQNNGSDFDHCELGLMYMMDYAVNPHMVYVKNSMDIQVKFKNVPSLLTF